MNVFGGLSAVLSGHAITLDPTTFDLRYLGNGEFSFFTLTKEGYTCEVQGLWSPLIPDTDVNFRVEVPTVGFLNAFADWPAYTGQPNWYSGLKLLSGTDGSSVNRASVTLDGPWHADL